jgi:hypothetical protein
MKKNHLYGLMVSAAALSLLSGCSDDFNPSGSGVSGKINPVVDLNGDVVASQSARSRAVQAITVNDLRLDLTSSDGSYTKSWNSIADFDNDQLFSVGSYTMSASYGALDQEGFESPYYYGESTFSVLENKVTNVSLTAQLANSMVTIEYTDAFKDYFTDYSMQLHAEGGDYIDYASDETRPAYLRPGQVTIIANVTKPNGLSAALEAAKFTAVARHHYTVTVDVNNGQAGDAEMSISFDDLVDQEEVVIDLSDELMSSPAPRLSYEGFEADKTYTLVDGMGADIEPEFTIIARGGISAVTLTTESATLIEQGWPAEVDLVSATDSQKTKLKSMGLDALGVFNNVDQIASVNLSNVLSYIRYSEGSNNTTKFTLIVKDKLGKVTEPINLIFDCEAVELTLSDPSTLANYSGDLDVYVTYNGTDLAKNVTFQTKNERGMWDNATINSVTAVSRSGNTYLVNLTVPATDEDVVLRAVCGSTTASQTLTIARTDTPYNLSVADNNVYGSYVIADIQDADGQSATLPSGAKIVVSTDGSTYSTATSSVDGTTVTISGLTPATKYYAMVKNGDATKAVSFTTESALVVPNGDFETLTQTLSETDMLQGGQWSISAGVYYDNTLSYTISEPTGWSSVNAKTTSGSTRNSWFVVPSTLNTSLTWTSTVPGLKLVGTGKGSDTPESLKDLPVKSGSNAMLIRNVAWAANGTRPDKWLKTGISTTEYYGHNEPDESSLTKSAGKLFLGSYSYSSGTETFNEGVSFTSRPTALKGYYTYANASEDTTEKAVVKVTLLNGSTVVGSGSIELSAVSSYTQFTVPVKYSKNAAKATSLRIMICSSNHSDESAIKTDVYNYRYESARHGAELVVDNLSFTY